MNFINLEYLEQITYNNKALISKLINGYLESIPEGLHKLTEAYDRQQWEEMSAIAHEMQSSAGIVGNDFLRSELRSLENHIMTGGEVNNIPLLMDKVRQSHQNTYIKIKEVACSLENGI